MDKPVFHWWAHKLMWDAVSHFTTDYCNRYVELSRILIKYGLAYPHNGCFACQSVCDYAGYPDGVENCQLCPLEWGTYSGTCYRKDSPYFLWTFYLGRGKFEEAAKYAAIIRDLPLKKNACGIYTVKESPYE